MMKNDRQLLLWANTAMTTLLLGVAGFLAIEVMNNGKTLIRVEERQGMVLKELPKLQQADIELRKELNSKINHLTARTEILERKLP